MWRPLAAGRISGEYGEILWFVLFFFLETPGHLTVVVDTKAGEARQVTATPGGNAVYTHLAFHGSPK